METHANDNKIIESNSNPEVLEFKYNFINTPWDDRSKWNKLGITLLLLSIFVSTMALVVNNFIMHYRGYPSVHIFNDTSSYTCHNLIKVDELRYVARIVSAATKELVCVGAVISPSSVIASGICIKFKPLKMYLGATDYRCKKGFSVDVFDSVPHKAIVSKKIVILSSYEDIQMCSTPINVGSTLNWDAKITIIGRHANLFSRFLTYRYASIAKHEDNLPESDDRSSSICLRDTLKCPVRAGDLMIQDGKLFGLAASSIIRNKVACFADVRIVMAQIQELVDLA